jgi:polyisoprenoid-binding protein YceI
MKTAKWILDPKHSELGFKIKHLMITNVSGVFKNFTVSAEAPGDDFSKSTIRLTADMTSISTNNEQRDAHLRNSDFFETDKFPDLVFQSTSIEQDGDDGLHVFGDLTMKGITKQVKLDVEYNVVTNDPWGGERAGFVVTGKIKRSDWGVTFNGVLESGGLMLGEEVKLNAEIQLVKEVVEVPA